MHRRIGPSIVVLVLIGVMWGSARGAAEPSESREYLLKAAFVYNFAKFIEWPAGAFAQPRDPLLLCTIGTEPFGAALASIDGKIVRDRPLEIKRLGGSDDPNACHMVFLTMSDKGRMTQVLQSLQRLPVLTISDTEGFLQVGGMINFFMAQNKIQFEINNETAQRVGLTISSQLLKLAMPERDGR